MLTKECITFYRKRFVKNAVVYKLKYSFNLLQITYINFDNCNPIRLQIKNKEGKILYVFIIIEGKTQIINISKYPMKNTIISIVDNHYHKGQIYLEITSEN